MDQQFEALLCASDAKQFVSTFRLIQQSYPSTDGLLADLVSRLAPSLHEPLYDQDPHGFYGITCAALTENLLPEPKRWRPYAQQLWALRKQRRRTPLELIPPASNSEATAEKRWGQFNDTYRSDFRSAFGLARSFLCNTDDRDYFRARTLIEALRDLALGGHKFNYMAQAWLLAERLGLKYAAEVLLGPLHLLATTDQERATFGEITKPRSNEKNQSRQPTTKPEEVTERVIFGTEAEALDALCQMQRTSENLPEQAVFDQLLLAAARTLACAVRNRWLPAVRAFHTAFLCQECHTWFAPEDRAEAVRLAAVIINRAARECRVDAKAPTLDETIQVVCPTEPFEVLKSVISHSDPYASATAIYAVLGMGDEARENLLQTLLAQALKNDGDICWGHDILFVAETWKAYTRSESARRESFPASAGFLLGQVLKKYSLAAEYGV